MELVQLPKKLTRTSMDRVSEDGNDESVLITNSRSVSEVASVFGSQTFNTMDNAPGNTVSMASDLNASFVKKTTVLDDDDGRFEVSSIRSLKEYNKTQSSDDLRQRKQRFNKNKVAPTQGSESDVERPMTAPINKERKWLEELTANRPMTAAATFKPTLSIPPPLQKKVEEIAEAGPPVKEVVEDAASIANEVHIDEDHLKPRINEMAYIPYTTAQAMIKRIVEDMSKMKVHHLSIITRMEKQYQQMELQTQEQFDECISQVQERHKKRLEHYRHVIEVLHTELKSKGALRADAIQSLKERNKELALERKKLKQQMSSSAIQIVPQHLDNRVEKPTTPQHEPFAEVPDEELSDDQQSVEEKIREDSQETEKKSLDGGITPVPAALVPVVRQEDEKDSEKGEDEEDEPEVEREAEALFEELHEDTEEDGGTAMQENEEDVEEIMDGLEEIVEEVEEDKKEEKDIETDIAAVVPVVIDEAKGVVEKQTKGKETTKQDSLKKKTPPPEKKKASPQRKTSVKHAEPVVSSADQATQNKQQILLANKQAKRIKASSNELMRTTFQELEKHAEMDKKKLEQNRNAVKQTTAQLEAAKNEVTTLQKEYAQQKAELKQLEEAAGAGTVALQQVPELKNEIQSLTVENQALVTNYNSERVLRKKYYNMVEDMKGKIRVYCRVRPLSKTEKANKNVSAVQNPDEYTVKIEMNRGGVKEFQFDEIFQETSTQAQVFEDTNSLIQSAVDGYNVCIFAYGQTGSGKTYTMIGDSGQTQPGIAPRAFDRIFEIAMKNHKKFTFKISCYMLELYNEKLVDLLVNAKDEPVKLDIKKDNKGMVVIQGSQVMSADTSEELFQIFLKGSANRHTASTKMNDESSRSHLIIGVIVESTNLTTGAITRGKLSLVDLAGSERVAKTGATAQQLKEANSINKSLSALGDVISALSSEQSFIPYRNNKLTMLMQDSLGGNAKTLMFVNISPADYNSDESAISLTYASRVKLITNDATKNAESKEVARLKQIIAKLKAGEALDE